jgi:tetratricopeptide (TPR) repeat protein
MAGLRSPRHLFFVSCVAVVLVVPTAAAAQPSAFVDGFLAFTNAAEGTYGDEGWRMTAALAAMSQGLAEWDDAIRAFEARVSTESSNASADHAAQLRLQLARMYAQRGRPADALREAEAASSLDPDRADALQLRGLLLDALGRRADAARAFRAAWRLDANDPINAYLLLRRAEAADSEDARAAHRLLTATYRTLLRDDARGRAFPSIAAAPLQATAGDVPVIPLAAYAGGYARITRGDYEGAIAEFRRAAVLDPLLVDPAAARPGIVQAGAALRERRVAEARALLEQADARQESSEVRRLLGLTYWVESQDERSLEQFAIAIQRNPRDERARLALARVLSSAGRYDEAARALEEALRVLPDAPLLRFWLGSEYDRLNRGTDARRELEAAAAGAIGGAGAIHVAVGRLATRTGDAAGAVVAFARASDANLNDIGAHKALAYALRVDRSDEAFVELVAAALVDPRDAEAHAAVGRLLLDERRDDEALAALRRAVALAPDGVEARYALATALMRTGHAAEAQQEFERVGEAQRRLLADRRRDMSLDVLQEEALLHASEGRHDRAAALYRQLADRYAQLGRPLDAARAQAMYERSRQAQPGLQESAR